MWNLALNLITLEVDISQEKMFTHNHAFFRENHSVLIMCAFQMYQRTWGKKIMPTPFQNLLKLSVVSVTSPLTIV